jgi:hypothetical protein
MQEKGRSKNYVMLEENQNIYGLPECKIEKVYNQDGCPRLNRQWIHSAHTIFPYHVDLDIAKPVGQDNPNRFI